jgi:hypothetical protein
VSEEIKDTRPERPADDLLFGAAEIEPKKSWEQWLANLSDVKARF